MSSKTNWEKHRSYVESLSGINNSCVFAAELFNGYVYISPNVSDMFYFNPESDNHQKNGLLFENIIHPADHALFVKLKRRVFEYIFSLPFNEWFNYKHIFEFRALNNTGNYVRVITQYHVLEADEVDKSVLLLGFVDISPDQEVDDSLKFKLVNLKNGNIIPFGILEKPAVCLTKREIEILNLINIGMSSKEISDKLFISFHTVNRHRQNIMEKMNVSNMVEAINYSRKMGAIE